MKYTVKSIYSAYSKSYLKIHKWFAVGSDYFECTEIDGDYEPDWKKYPEYSWEEEWDDSMYPPLFDDIDPDDLVDIDFDDEDELMVFAHIAQ